MNFIKASNLLQTLQNRQRKILGSEEFSNFAVLLPILEENGESKILFEVRAHHMRRKPGEICFPGGKVDKNDSSEKETAYRETYEELGIDKSGIANVTALDYIVSPFGSIIYPFAGIITKPERIIPNADEVDEAFTVPLAFFLENSPKKYKINYQVKPDKNFPLSDIEGGENYNWNTRGSTQYFYYYHDKVIWGLTAKILYHFILLLKNKI